MTVRMIDQAIAVLPSDTLTKSEQPDRSDFEDEEVYNAACLAYMCEYVVYAIVTDDEGEYLDQITIGYIKKTPSSWAFLPMNENNWALYSSKVMSDISTTMSMLEQDEEVVH